MITVKDLLNKIKWGSGLNPADYDVFYLDRVANRLIKIKFNEIKTVENNFFETQDKSIPLHRIRKIENKGEVIWERIMKS